MHHSNQFVGEMEGQLIYCAESLIIIKLRHSGCLGSSLSYVGFGIRRGPLALTEVSRTSELWFSTLLGSTSLSKL
jgi:hypothetical protein